MQYWKSLCNIINRVVEQPSSDVNELHIINYFPILPWLGPWTITVLIRTRQLSHQKINRNALMFCIFLTLNTDQIFTKPHPNSSPLSSDNYKYWPSLLILGFRLSQSSSDSRRDPYCYPWARYKLFFQTRFILSCLFFNILYLNIHLI